MKPRYLLDEHVDVAIQRQLRRMILNIDVRCIHDRDALPKGTPDDDLLAWADLNAFIVVTEDRRTMPGAIGRHVTVGQHIAGVLFIRPHTSIGAIIESLELIWHTSEQEEFVDRTQFIPL